MANCSKSCSERLMTCDIVARCFRSLVDVMAAGFFTPASRTCLYIAFVPTMLVVDVVFANRYKLFSGTKNFRSFSKSSVFFTIPSVNRTGTPRPRFPFITIRLNDFIRIFSLTLIQSSNSLELFLLILLMYACTVILCSSPGLRLLSRIS